MPKKHDKKGRSTTERFVALPHYMLKSASWLDLPSAARALLIELAVLYNGSNNGYLYLSARAAGDRMRCSKDTACRHFKTLQDHGFVAITAPGSFDYKERHATEWRLTWLKCDRTGDLPTKAFLRPKTEAGPI